MINIHAIQQMFQSDEEKQKYYKQWQVGLHTGNRNGNITVMKKKME
jgi:hypothetical protein